jgi:4-hydroxy-tetrahydrodipicolinate synthase
VLIQDYPLVSPVRMTPMVIPHMVGELGSCIMFKHADGPGPEQISVLRGFERDRTMLPIAILWANNGTILDFEMARRAEGANTGQVFP